MYNHLHRYQPIQKSYRLRPDVARTSLHPDRYYRVIQGREYLLLSCGDNDKCQRETFLCLRRPVRPVKNRVVPGCLASKVDIPWKINLLSQYHHLSVSGSFKLSPPLRISISRCNDLINFSCSFLILSDSFKFFNNSLFCFVKSLL